MKWLQIRKRNEDLERELRSDLELEEQEQRDRGRVGRGNSGRSSCRTRCCCRSAPRRVSVKYRWLVQSNFSRDHPAQRIEVAWGSRFLPKER